jgi:hypothetical protein
MGKDPARGGDHHSLPISHQSLGSAISIGTPDGIIGRHSEFEFREFTFPSIHAINSMCPDALASVRAQRLRDVEIAYFFIYHLPFDAG